VHNALTEILADTVLEEFSCAGIYIDENYEVINAIGDFKKYIELPDKRLNLNILKMVPEEVHSTGDCNQEGF
jgi:two-component system CheB/CheR fusion protein